MKKFVILAILYIPISAHGFTSAYLGWEPFSSTALPTGSTADTLVFGVLGNTTTRVYFAYNILANFIYTKGAVNGNLGWG
ncbi:MAG: hypothetical protein ACRCTJ_00730, partial [Brevinema sp.]